MQHSEPNFTAGKIPVQLFHFSVPLFFANVLQAAYHLVDMMVIGHFVGSSGLAAVGNASMLCFIINSIGIGITLGGTVEVARAHGRGDVVCRHRRGCVAGHRVRIMVQPGNFSPDGYPAGSASVRL